MFIKNERTMEDYIQADGSFNKYIEDMYLLKNVKLLGRQVHIGDHNIIDLLYEGDGSAPYNDKSKCLVVVELKLRALEMVDLAQIGRYTIGARAYIYDNTDEHDKDCKVYPLLVGTGLTEDFAHFMNGSLQDEDLRVMLIKSDVIYEDVTNKLWTVEDFSGKIDPSFNEFVKGLKGNGEAENG